MENGRKKAAAKISAMVLAVGVLVSSSFNVMAAGPDSMAGNVPMSGTAAAAGKKLVQKTVRRGRTVMDRHSYAYDEAGRLVQETITDGVLPGITAPGMDFGIYENDVSAPDTVISYVYDEQGRLAAKYMESAALHTVHYIYDERGNMVKEASHYTRDFSDEPWQWTDYSYDENGNLIGKAEWSVDVRNIKQHNFIVRAQYAYSYDEQGRLLLETMTPGGGFDYAIVQFEEERIAHEYHAYQRVYSYDAQGRIAKTVDYDGSGNVTGEAVYTYNKAGSAVQRAIYGSRGQQSSCEYDIYGNVTRVNVKVQGTGADTTEQFENVYQ